MEITKKFAAMLTATILVSFLCGYYTSPIIQTQVHKTPQASVNVFIFKETAEGKTILASGNLITDIGEEYIRDAFSAGGSINQTKWISLSNDANPSAAWIELPNELDNTNGFGRALGTVTEWAYSGDYAFNVTKKFTATGSVTAQCAGLQWNDVASDNNLFAAAAFTQTTFAANDNCTIIWIIVFDAN